MANNDLGDVLASIDAAIDRLKFLRSHLPDVYAVAHRKGGHGSEGGRSGTREHHYGDEVGNPMARAIWRRAWGWFARGGGVELARLEAGLRKFLSDGVPGDETGTLVSVEEFQRALAMQRKRGHPARLVEQPRHPNEPREKA